MTLTSENLADRVRYWSGVLRLQDWDIDVAFVRRHELGARYALGQSTMDCYRRARIRIVDPIDYNDKDHWPIDRDSEATLLHELMHLHMYDLRVIETQADGRDTPEWTALERVCETVARSLLQLERLTSPNGII